MGASVWAGEKHTKDTYGLRCRQLVSGTFEIHEERDQHEIIRAWPPTKTRYLSSPGGGLAATATAATTEYYHHQTVPVTPQAVLRTLCGAGNGDGMAWMEGSDYQLEFCNDDPHPGVISQLSAI